MGKFDDYINVTAPLHSATVKGKLGNANEIFLEGDTKNIENEIKEINSRHEKLNKKHDTLSSKHESLSRTVQGIAVTGEASTATNVTYNNDTSGLNAENTQDAIDELQSSKIDKTSILQESGTALDKIMSQKAVSTKLSDLYNKINKTLDIQQKNIEELSISDYKPTFSGLGGKGNLVTNSYNATEDFIPIGDSSSIFIVDSEGKRNTQRRISLYTSNNETAWINNIENVSEFNVSSYPTAKFFRIDNGTTSKSDLDKFKSCKIHGAWTIDAPKALERDSVPTNGSNNLVESGGVYSEIKETANSFLNKIVRLGSYNLISNDWSSGLLNSSGVPTGLDNGYSSSILFKVLKGHTYRLCSTSNASELINRIAFYSDNSSSSLINITAFNLNVSEFTANQSCYCRISVALNAAVISKRNYMLIDSLYFDSIYNGKYIENDPNKNYLVPNIYINEDNVIKKSEATTPLIELYAFATSSDAVGIVNDEKKYFVGVVENINAIQRAINSIPSNTYYNYIIYCKGEFIATSYSDMSTIVDAVSPNYRCYVALYKKKNITLRGVGNKGASIFVSLPDVAEKDNEGANISTSLYHPLEIRDTKNCSIENISLSGHNIRYTIHVNGLEQEYQKLFFRNVDISYIHNSGEHATWSGANVGCDIPSGFELHFEYCRGAKLIGHYSVGGLGKTLISFKGCYAPTCEIAPSANTPSLNSVAVVEYIGCNFNDYSPVSTNANNNTLKRIFMGYGNTPMMIRKLSNNFDVQISDVVERIASSVPIGNLIDRTGVSANGKIYAVVSNIDNENAIVLRNCRYAIVNQINIADGYTPKKGDFCIAEEGLLKKADFMTNAEVIEIGGTLWLEIN